MCLHVYLHTVDRYLAPVDASCHSEHKAATFQGKQGHVAINFTAGKGQEDIY